MPAQQSGGSKSGNKSKQRRSGHNVAYYQRYALKYDITKIRRRGKRDRNVAAAKARRAANPKLTATDVDGGHVFATPSDLRRFIRRNPRAETTCLSPQVVAELRKPVEEPAKK